MRATGSPRRRREAMGPTKLRGTRRISIRDDEAAGSFRARERNAPDCPPPPPPRLLSFSTRHRSPESGREKRFYAARGIFRGIFIPLLVQRKIYPSKIFSIKKVTDPSSVDDGLKATRGNLIPLFRGNFCRPSAKRSMTPR